MLLSDRGLDMLLEDIARVPLIDETDIDRYEEGRWLHEPSCGSCGTPLYRRTLGCVTCQNRHEKRRQRGGTPAPLIGSPRARSVA
jgi:uncharacterized Zn finger protein (UPF0148 family)